MLKKRKQASFCRNKMILEQYIMCNSKHPQLWNHQAQNTYV